MSAKPAARVGDLIGHAPQEIARLGPAAPGVLAAGAASMTATSARPDTKVRPVGVPPKIATGAIIKGSTTVLFDYLPAAYKTGALAPCAVELGTPIPIKDGSSFTTIDGKPAARLSDAMTCKAAILSGSSVVDIDDTPKPFDRPRRVKTLLETWAEKDAGNTNL